MKRPYSEKYSILSIISKCIARIFHLEGFINAAAEKILIKKSKDFNIVFIDRSIYGTIAPKIKYVNPKVKIISFFHNVELDLAKSCGSGKRGLLKTIHNEKMVCEYSDITIAFNDRDAQRIEQLYGRKTDAVIPVSFADRQIVFSKGPISEVPTALFFGSKFQPNVHGINWFIKNVLPFVNIKLQVIMKDLENEKLPQSGKLELMGFVEDLEPYIQNADFTLFPIFTGSGMKVKVCEALMYGKNIIATGEAFMGYDVDFEKVGACCETADEFIKAINEFSQRFNNKFNEYSRNIFLQKYSNDITFSQFAKVFKINSKAGVCP
ncbi:MAG: glycosyltransferase [Chitinispirillales bacterium]|nr:glycosyltransferase [Chitinispirillales bacterium]